MVKFPGEIFSLIGGILDWILLDLFINLVSSPQ